MEIIGLYVELLVIVVLAVNSYYMAKLLKVFKEVGKAIVCLLEEYEDLHELICKMADSITELKSK